MVTHLAFITKIGKKQKTLALNNKKRGKAKSTQKKQKHTYLINGQTYISNRENDSTSAIIDAPLASPGDFAFSLTIQYTIQFFKVLGQYNAIPIQYNILKNCTQYVTIF